MNFPKKSSIKHLQSMIWQELVGGIFQESKIKDFMFGKYANTFVTNFNRAAEYIKQND